MIPYMGHFQYNVPPQPITLQEFMDSAKACLSDEASGKNKQADVKLVLSRVADYMRRNRVR